LDIGIKNEIRSYPDAGIAFIEGSSTLSTLNIEFKINKFHVIPIFRSLDAFLDFLFAIIENYRFLYNNSKVKAKTEAVISNYSGSHCM